MRLLSKQQHFTTACPRVNSPALISPYMCERKVAQLLKTQKSRGVVVPVLHQEEERPVVCFDRAEVGCFFHFDTPFSFALGRMWERGHEKWKSPDKRRAFSFVFVFGDAALLYCCGARGFRQRSIPSSPSASGKYTSTHTSLGSSP